MIVIIYKKILIYTICLIVLLGFLQIISSILLPSLQKIVDIPCSDTVVSTAQSLDKRYLAIIVDRDCGATTSYAQHVLLKETSTNNEIVDASTVSVIQGQGIKQLVWRDNHTLIVEFDHTDSKFFHKDIKWKDITILYRQR